MTTFVRPLVLVIISHLAVGGAENIAISLAERAADSAVFLFFVVLEEKATSVVQNAMASKLRAIGAEVVFGTRLPFKRGGALAAAWRLRQLILRSRPDVIHVHTEIPELTIAVALLTLPEGWAKRVLRSVHNTRLWSGWGGVGRWVTRRLSSAMVVGVSEAALAADDHLRKLSGLPKVPAERSKLIYNGVKSPKRKRPLRGQVGMYEGAVARPLQLLFAGRFEHQKGVDMLPAILERAATASSAHAEVTLIGEGSLHAAVRDRLDGNYSAWPIRYLDAMPDLGEQFYSYDLVLMPSRFEGLGLVAIEAGLACVPVITFAAPGLLEVIPSTDPLCAAANDVEDFSSKLVTFLSDPSHFDDLVRSREVLFAKKFSIDSMVNSYIKIYNQLSTSFEHPKASGDG